MKKSVISLALAGALFAAAVPALAGCSAQVGYTLITGEDGQKYYEVAASGFTGSLEGELQIPEYYGEGESRFPVKAIADHGFANTSYTKITLPATITQIGNAAFSYNTYLKEVEFSNCGIDAIPWGAFGNCPSLKTVDIPAGVTMIDGMAFYDCASLESVSLPASLQNINIRAFYGCSALSAVAFPAGLLKIGPFAFMNCYALSRAILPDSLRDEEVQVKDEEGNPVTDKSGNPVTELEPALGQGVFYNCTSLKLAVLGSGITVVQEGLFGGCTSLESVYLPASLKQIKGVYSSGDMLIAHPFYATALKEVHFGGTEQQWQQVTVDNISYESGGYVSDNAALINAQKYFESVYGGSADLAVCKIK